MHRTILGASFKARMQERHAEAGWTCPPTSTTVIGVSEVVLKSAELGQLKSSMAAARMAYGAGDFHLCARHYGRAIELAEQNGLAGAIVAEAFIYLSVCLSARKEFQEAETLLNKALSISQADLHGDAIILALNYHELSVLYWRTGREQGAREMNNRALAALDDTAPNLAELKVMILKHKAVLLSDEQRFKEANAALETAMDICLRSKELGKNSLAYGQTLITKVLLCIDTQRFDEARELYFQAIQIIEMCLGAHHPKVADLYDIFANHAKGANKEEVCELFRKKSKDLREWIKKSYKW
jgi:tetratricopeptide (TPR) repeat protein